MGDVAQMRTEDKRSVLVIYTGGTMGMKRDEAAGTLKPEPGYLTQQIKELPEMSNPEMPLYNIVEFDVLIDSSWYNYMSTYSYFRPTCILFCLMYIFMVRTYNKQYHNVITFLVWDHRIGFGSPKR